MLSRIRFSGWIVVLAIAIRADVARAQIPDSVRLAVNRVFTSAANDAPGCSVGVSRDGRPIFENGYGMANLETSTPNTAGTIFHVASVSKQFTAMAIMLLAKDGKLSLDDDIRKFLPEIPDYGHRITIRHMLHHTSGLRDQWDLLAMARGRFEENRITEADVLEIIPRQKSLNFSPGSEYLYSNTGYTLAGTIVKRVSGKSLREFADERIFRPLGMMHTHFHDDYTMVVKSRAAAYVRRDGAWHVSLPNYDTYGATSLFSTAGDLLEWEANFAKRTIGDEAMFREMDLTAKLTDGSETGYGLGRATEVFRGAKLVGHSGGDAGYRSYLGQFPEHGIGVAVLCNSGEANAPALARSVAEVFLTGKLAPVEPPPKAAVTLSAAELRLLAGLYANTNTSAMLFVTLRGDALILGRTAGPTLVPVAPRRFRLSTGAPIEFEFTGEGTLVQHPPSWSRSAPIRFTRVEPATPKAAELQAYAGTYHSEELGATYTVTATDSTLVFRTRGGVDRIIRPVYGETFAGTYTVTFTRKGGRVDGMTMSSGRVRRVRFERR